MRLSHPPIPKRRNPRCHRCGRCHPAYPNPRCRIKVRARNRYKARYDKDGHKLYAPYGRATTIERFGKLLTWNEMNGKERKVTALRIKGARNRNKFWRALGFPNLKKALAAQKRYREERLKAGLLPVKKLARLERVANQEVPAVSPDEARAAEIWLSGKVERKEQRVRKVLLGDLLPAGNYDPAYLMRREMRILDVMSRCPA
jgi:hypothetical protein